MTTNHQPALAQLKYDFDEHMENFRTGVQTSEDLVLWLHKTSVLTLGAIPNKYFTELTQGAISSSILLGRSATNPRRKELETDYDRSVRRRLEDHLFTPTFQSAFVDLRENATEYISEEETTSKLDKLPAEDKPPALRPALSALQEQQRELLEKSLQDDGFETCADLSDWLREVVSATRGHIREGFVDSVAGRDPTLRGAYIADGRFEEPTRQNYLQTVAAHELLPACNLAIRDLSSISGEKRPLEESDDGMAKELGA